MAELSFQYLHGRPAPEILGSYASLGDPLESAAIVAQWDAVDANGWNAWRWLVARDAAGEVAAAVAAVLQAGSAALLHPVRIAPHIAAGQPLLPVAADDEDDDNEKPPPDDLRQSLLRAFVRELDAEGVALLQAVLPTIADDATALAAVGFQPAANLLYLVCDAKSPPPSPRVTFRPANDLAALAAVIDQTYQGTLDCPALNGVRDTADVVAGYLASGASGGTWWRLAEENGAVIGCVLTATHPGTLSSELVYMGVVPAARGRQLGGDLIAEAQRLAHASGMEQSVLAVDAANRPALAAYERAGYTAFDRRRVWLRSRP